MVIIGLFKSRKTILAAQCVQFVLQGSGHLVLGATGGLICSAVSLLRNLAFFKVKSSVWLKVFFIALQAIPSIPALLTDPVTILVILAGAVFAWFIDSQDVLVLKKVIVVCQVLWLVYDLCFMNYAGAFFDLTTIISTSVSIILTYKNAKKSAEV